MKKKLICTNNYLKIVRIKTIKNEINMNFNVFKVLIEF